MGVGGSVIETRFVMSKENEEEDEEEIHVMSKEKYFMVTWRKCKLVMIALILQSNRFLKE
jgi:hypothetical protein